VHDEPIEAVLQRTQAQRDALAERLAERQRAEDRELDRLRQQIASDRSALERSRAALTQQLVRVSQLQSGQQVALAARVRVRKALHVVIRGALGLCAFGGWLMIASTTSLGPLVVIGSAVLGGAGVWGLGNLADHEDLKGG